MDQKNICRYCSRELDPVIDLIGENGPVDTTFPKIIGFPFIFWCDRCGVIWGLDDNGILRKAFPFSFPLTEEEEREINHFKKYPRKR